jgi:hypothetical protein
MEIPSALCKYAVRVQVEGKEKIGGWGWGDGRRKYVMGSEIRIYFLVVSKKCRRE